MDKRGTRSKPQKRQNIDFLIVIATTYLKTSSTKIPQNRGRYPLQRRDLPRFCHDNVPDVSIPRPFRGLISPPHKIVRAPRVGKISADLQFYSPSYNFTETNRDSGLTEHRHPRLEQAIAREKQIKHYKRDWKNELVDLMNPNWEDLTGNIIIDPDIV